MADILQSAQPIGGDDTPTTPANGSSAVTPIPEITPAPSLPETPPPLPVVHPVPTEQAIPHVPPSQDSDTIAIGLNTPSPHVQTTVTTTVTSQPQTPQVANGIGTPPPVPIGTHKKSSLKGVIAAVLLLLAVSIPLGVYYFARPNELVTEQRSRAAYPTETPTPTPPPGGGGLPPGTGPVCSPVGLVEWECPADNPENRCHQCGSNNQWIQTDAPGCTVGGQGYFFCDACSDPARVCYQGGGGGTGQCPPDQVIWCATFDCPLGDENEDGECNPNSNGPGDPNGGDPHATYTTQWGDSCSLPASGCGQVDKYNNGSPGVDWLNYCGHSFINFDNCSGVLPTPPPSGQCLSIIVYDAAGLDITEALRTGARTLNPNETVTMATPKGNASKARFRIVGLTDWIESDISMSTEYRANITIPQASQSQATFEAEVYIDSQWK
ncbi:MAG: hypothetical protein Q7S76_03485 [bacterium]|nr:hypothetical protein [bacterium]